MKEPVELLDTGPCSALLSFLAAGLEHHSWAVEQWKALRPPLLTCEQVLTEAAFLLKREGRDADALFAMLERGIIRIAAGGPSRPHAPLPQSADVAGWGIPFGGMSCALTLAAAFFHCSVKAG